MEEVQTYFHMFVPVGESWQNLEYLGTAQERALPLNKRHVLEPVYLGSCLHVTFVSSTASAREDWLESVAQR